MVAPCWPILVCRPARVFSPGLMFDGGQAQLLGRLNAIFNAVMRPRYGSPASPVLVPQHSLPRATAFVNRCGMSCEPSNHRKQSVDNGLRSASPGFTQHWVGLQQQCRPVARIWLRLRSTPVNSLGFADDPHHDAGRSHRLWGSMRGRPTAFL
jgi:hypothetical protein